MFLIAKTYKYSNILFYRCLDCARHDKGNARHDKGNARHDKGDARHDKGDARHDKVSLDMTRLAGSDPDECHTDEDERQIDGLGAEIPLLEDEGGACE